jgi:RimJ/RimL family protein N-acetyltransferase
MAMTAPPVVRGHRLILRPFRRDDIDATYLSWVNDPERMRFSRHRHERHDSASSLEYLRSFEGTPHYFWAVEAIETHELLGTMTAYADADAVDLGILIGPGGRGLGREAWGVALDHLLRVEARAKASGGTVAEHQAMRRIFERWGMALLATEPSFDGTATVVRYAVTREGWMRRFPGDFLTVLSSAGTERSADVDR